MNEPEATDSSARSVANREGKYLTFSLAGEEYGIGILKVKEIIGMMAITAVPQTPGYIKGVVNLRGKVIPIVDLRLKFGLAATAATEKTCIIVVEVTGIAQQTLIGILVDSVTEVLNIRGADIEAVPDFGTQEDMSSILGMAKTGGTVKILLDIDSVLASQDLHVINQAA